MKTGIVQVSDYIKDMSKSKIPLYASDFKREYQFIRGLNLYCDRLSKRLDRLNHGLFETDLAFTIKKYMKRFLRAQEKGKFTNISKFVFPSYASKDFFNILFIYDQLLFCKERYDNFKYYINVKYFKNLNLYINIDNDNDNNVNIESDSDSDSDSDNDNDYSDRGIYCERESIVDGKPYPGFIEFYDYFKRIFVQFKFGDSDSDTDSNIDIDIGSDSDSDK